MAARLRGTEEDQASEEEEEEEEEEAYWEYDSTWEEEGEEDGGQQEEDHLGRKESEGAAAAAAADDDVEEIKNQENSQPHSSPSWWSPSTMWASGSQDQRKPKVSHMGFRRWKTTNGRNWMAAKDMQIYRQRYPGLEEIEIRDEEEMWNLSFYKNEICFMPHGLFIEDLLETWQNDYVTLEENHSYIQWLFPLREKGMNWRARILTCQEIQAFKKSKEVMERFIRAYKLMLGFYGIDLINEETGELRRAKNWRERFENLNRYSHNNLRITRILKCLGEMGYEHYQTQLVKFFLTETLVHQELPRVQRSTLDYFMFTVRNKQQRQELVHFAWQHFTPKCKFVWGPQKKLRRFKPQCPELLSNERLAKQQEPAQDGDGEEAPGKNKTKLPNKTHQTEEEEHDRKEAAGEAVSKEQATLPDETCTSQNAAEQTANDLTGHPVSKPVPGNLSVGKSTSVAAADGLQAGETAEPETSPGGENKARKPMSETVAKVSAEKDNSKEETVVSSLHLGRQESGADGESLKESKKRKLEINRVSEGNVGVLKSPTDIEKISFNLREVMIDQKGQGDLPLMEKVKPSVPEGSIGDDRHIKEMESTDAVAKRRKVEEMALEDGVTKTPVKVMSCDSKIRNCPGAERTDPVCQDEKQTISNASVNPSADCRTFGKDLLVDSRISAKQSLPVAGCALGKSDEQETTSAKNSKRLQASETLPSSENQVGGNPRQKEEEDMVQKAEKMAGENKAAESVESNSVEGPAVE